MCESPISSSACMIRPSGPGWGSKQAIDAGASSLMEPDDMFWGDRFGSVQDPFGHSWTIATHIEDVSPEEMEKRSEEWMAQMAATAGS